MYDVIIIGAGASGSAIARELSRYQGKFCVLEKETDVCCGTSKANSGIVHAGFDAEEGSLMAKLNVEGNKMMEKLSKELDFSYQKNGSLVVCTNESEVEKLNELLERGKRNGVEGLQILDREELKALEPNISDEAVAALYAPTGGIVCPFGLTIAFAENAAQNGVEFCLDQEVKKIERRIAGGYRICTQDTMYETKVIVNAAGVYADVFHNMVSEKKIHITARKGEYFLLDKTAGGHVSHTVFTLPGKFGKDHSRFSQTDAAFCFFPYPTCFLCESIFLLPCFCMKFQKTQFLLRLLQRFQLKCCFLYVRTNQNNSAVFCVFHQFLFFQQRLV